MSAGTKIEWADHTMNPWTGCAKVSAGCNRCYAETFARRFKIGWGAGAERRPASEKSWAEPIRWNKAAQRQGKRARVFCASMADVFEDRPELVAPRARLWKLIEATRWLDWMILTKRPENFHLAPWLEFPNLKPQPTPPNVWLGVSVENQAAADTRIPILLRTPAAIRFISAEPLLGPVDLYRGGFTFLEPLRPPPGNKLGHDQGLDWVIAGGESGHGARPMHPEWARSLRDQCQAAGVPFLFKQWGEWAPPDGRLRLLGPDDGIYLRHNQIHNPMERMGKKAAGRLLDGREWNEMPESKA